MKNFSLFALLTGTFGIGSAAAGVIFWALKKAFGEGLLNLGRLILLTAGTGIGAVILIGILAFGRAYIARKLKAGKGAVVAW